MYIPGLKCCILIFLLLLYLQKVQVSVAIGMETPRSVRRAADTPLKQQEVCLPPASSTKASNA